MYIIPSTFVYSSIVEVVHAEDMVDGDYRPSPRSPSSAKITIIAYHVTSCRTHDNIRRCSIIRRRINTP